MIEVDGREKQVDTYYFNKSRPEGAQRLPLMYWGKYVAHDNNRDGMGQFLALTRNVTRFFLEWTPTIMHDLHEAQTYLYASTGTGPCNEALDPITTDEWWLLAKTEVMEMTKRGVPGVWTYGFYDGWVPNYMFFIAHSHNAIGRFYEVQSYGPDNYEVRPGATTTSREWFRPNPPLPSIQWGPRNNVNIQQSALLLVLDHVAKNRELYLENYWLKNKRSVEKGRTESTPNLGALDQSDDIRGGMGSEGLMELVKFVQQGGTLLVEGSTATILPEYGVTPGVTVENPSQLFARGSIMRGIISDPASPIAYGYAGGQLPVYFNQDPVLNAGSSGIPAELLAFLGGGSGIPGVGQNTTPMATPVHLSPWEEDSTAAPPTPRDEIGALRQMMRAFGIDLDQSRPRVVMSFPSNPNDMLLSGTLAGGQYLSGRAQVVDAPLGEGHVVMFAIRPFWRWQTQGTFFLGFNAILNWNDLDAGVDAEGARPTTSQRQR